MEEEEEDYIAPAEPAAKRQEVVGRSYTANLVYGVLATRGGWCGVGGDAVSSSPRAVDIFVLLCERQRVVHALLWPLGGR